jgi:biopolymer transport protein ExbD
MAASHYDVWLTAAQRVYQAVPYAVVADWLQQGRVLAGDRVRPAGAADWRPVAECPPLAVYLPSADPAVPDDRAEALEPVELGIAVRRGRAGEDDDVDMVPLIDISLVLLIFFMMTATVAVGASGIPLPETSFAVATADRAALWVGVDFGPDAAPVYSLGADDRPPAAGEDKLTLEHLLARLRERLKSREAGRAVTVRVAAHSRMPVDVVQRLTTELTELKALGLADIKAEVAERAP